MSSLRQNLAQTLLGGISVLASASLFAIYLASRYTITGQFDNAQRAKAQVIETLTRTDGNGITVSFSNRFFHGFDDDEPHPRDFYQIWDSTGRPLNHSESLQHASLQFQSGLTTAGRFWAVTLPDGRPGRAFGLTFVPHAHGQRATGPLLTLIVVSDRAELDRNLRVLLALCAGSGLILLGSTLWLIPYALGRGLKPLERLGEQAAAIDSKTLGTRFEVEPLPKELRPIAGRLNDLLSRIEQSFERERRFSADLAHELRTPLTELRALAECALRWPEEQDASLHAETLAIALQMERMVGHMLALARSEEGQIKVNWEPVVWEEVVASRWERIQPRAVARGLTARFEPLRAEVPVLVSADPTLVRAILDNLMENAVEYASAGGEIQLRVTETGCVISNTARGLEPADVARLFERFWRKESARTDGLHVGLGLPLSRAFAEAMGWSLSARLTGPDQLTLALVWRRSPDEPAAAPRAALVSPSPA